MSIAPMTASTGRLAEDAQHPADLGISQSDATSFRLPMKRCRLWCLWLIWPWRVQPKGTVRTKYGSKKISSNHSALKSTGIQPLTMWCSSQAAADHMEAFRRWSWILWTRTVERWTLHHQWLDQLSTFDGHKDTYNDFHWHWYLHRYRLRCQTESRHLSDSETTRFGQRGMVDSENGNYDYLMAICRPKL